MCIAKCLWALFRLSVCLLCGSSAEPKICVRCDDDACESSEWPFGISFESSLHMIHRSPLLCHSSASQRARYTACDNVLFWVKKNGSARSPCECVSHCPFAHCPSIANIICGGPAALWQYEAHTNKKLIEKRHM